MLHLMFSSYLAGMVREALTVLGRDDDVLSLNDNFSMGPVAEEAMASRDQWIDHLLLYDEFDDPSNRDAFLDALLSSSSPPVVWVDSASSACRSGFLWWLSHIGDLPFKLIEEACLNTRNVDEFSGRIGQEVAISDQKRAELVAHWRRLQAENAPLRVIEEGELVSAPLDYFDDALMRQAKTEWRKKARLVGGVLWEHAEKDVWPVAVDVLFARLATLTHEGRLELRGDKSHRLTCEVRLPPAES